MHRPIVQIQRRRELSIDGVSLVEVAISTFFVHSAGGAVGHVDMEIDRFDVAERGDFVNTSHEHGTGATSSDIRPNGHLSDVHEGTLRSGVSQHGAPEFLMAAFDATDD